MPKPVVLILCTGNSCRSHMAEGLLRRAAGDLFEVHSAGSAPAGYVHSRAVEVMREIDVDLTGHESKSIERFTDRPVDTVITVCDNANEACPVFPGQAHRYHWSFEDPAKASGTDEEILAAFRDVRDRIRTAFEAFAAGYRQGVGKENRHG